MNTAAPGLMNDRTRFLATMHYEPRDRCPICDFSFWPETIDLWKQQGLPDWVSRNYDAATQNKFFGMDSYQGGPGGDIYLRPVFETRVVEDRGEHEVIQDASGVILLRKKHMGSIPVHLDHTLKDRASWEKHFKPRLNPEDPARLPQDWEAARQVWHDADCPYPRSVWLGSFYGWIRDWMGMENVSYLVYDDPALFEEIVVTLTDVKVAVLKKMYEQGARFDLACLWEDMCFNSGPLLAPEHFKQYIMPQMKRVTEILYANGCDIVFVDCDGKIDDLIPHWLEAGVNCMFPVEVGTWGADPIKLRRQFGKELLMMGGFDKHLLMQGPAAIEKEVQRLAPLVEQGGYIPMPDHRVPPDVTLANYLHYLRTARAIWGRGVNLRPLGTPEPHGLIETHLK